MPPWTHSISLCSYSFNLLYNSQWQPVKVQTAISNRLKPYNFNAVTQLNSGDPLRNSFTRFYHPNYVAALEQHSAAAAAAVTVWSRYHVMICARPFFPSDRPKGSYATAMQCQPIWWTSSHVQPDYVLYVRSCNHLSSTPFPNASTTKKPGN